MASKTNTKTKQKKLNFAFGNAKLSNKIAIFSLPAGHSCPFADKCLSKANRITGKITDGPNTQFRCYAASEEAPYTSTRNSRWNNFDLLLNAKTMEKMALLIQSSLPSHTHIIRIHASGDFFSEKYFLAWLNVALNNPSITFYGYTKSLAYLVKYKKHIPKNLRLTASKGGKLDHLIKKHNLKFAEVVFSEQEALEKNLDIDHDDSLAIYSNNSLALLLHGTQAANTPAQDALQKLRALGVGGYSKNKSKLLHSIPTLTFKIHVKFTPTPPKRVSKNFKSSALTSY
jgi:Gene product 88